MENEERVYVSIDGVIIPITTEEHKQLSMLYADCSKYATVPRDVEDLKQYSHHLKRKYETEKITIVDRYYVRFSGVSESKIRAISKSNKGRRFW